MENLKDLKDLNKDDLKKTSVKDLLTILDDGGDDVGYKMIDRFNDLYESAIDISMMALSNEESGIDISNSIYRIKSAGEIFRELDRINNLLGEIAEDQDSHRLPSPDVMEQYKSVIEYANNQAKKHEGLANDLREELSAMRKKYEREFYIKNSLFIFLREKGLTGEFKAWYEIEGQKSFPVDFENQSKSLEEVKL